MKKCARPRPARVSSLRDSTIVLSGICLRYCILKITFIYMYVLTLLLLMNDRVCLTCPGGGSMHLPWNGRMHYGWSNNSSDWTGLDWTFFFRLTCSTFNVQRSTFIPPHERLIDAVVERRSLPFGSQPVTHRRFCRSPHAISPRDNLVSLLRVDLVP